MAPAFWFTCPHFVFATYRRTISASLVTELAGHRMYAFNSNLGPVECRAELTPDGRFAAVVVLIGRIDGAPTMVTHTCPGSDILASDAVAKARAWAEKNFPPRPPVDAQ